MKSLILRLVGTAALLWLLTVIFPARFVISGGTGGFVVVTLIVAVANELLRPLLALLALPFLLLFTFLARLAINIVLILLCQKILVALGGAAQLQLADWTVTIVAALALGLLHWLLKR